MRDNRRARSVKSIGLAAARNSNLDFINPTQWSSSDRLMAAGMATRRTSPTSRACTVFLRRLLRMTSMFTVGDATGHG